MPSNNPPTNISLSSNVVEENVAVNTQIGVLSAADESEDVHTFSLVSGEGDADNALFSIVDATLNIITTPDYETKSLYSIRVGVEDGAGRSFQKSFLISVLDVVEDEEFPCRLSEITVTDPDGSYSCYMVYSGARHVKDIYFKLNAGDDFFLYDSIVYVWNDDGKKIEERAYLDGVVQSDIDFSYDNNKRLSYTMEFNSSEEFVERWDYVYADDDTLASSVVRYDESGTEQLGTHTEYIYDEQGRVSNSKSFAPDRDGNVGLISEWSFVYDENDNVTLETRIDSETVIEHTYEYDDQGLLVSEKRSWISGELSPREEVYEFEYSGCN